MPTIGIMHSGSKGKADKQITAFTTCLKWAGYDTTNITFAPANPLYADDDPRNLDQFAKDLVDATKYNVDVIVAAGGPHSAIAAMKSTAGTNNKWVVFTSFSDPVSPAANMTGICALTSALDPDRLNLLHELMPKEQTIGVLVNSQRDNYATQKGWLDLAANNLGLNLQRADVNPGDGGPPDPKTISTAFTGWAAAKIPVLVTADPFFNNHRDKVQKIPAIYQWREFADEGGLMSYGTNLTQAYALAGSRVGGILDYLRKNQTPVLPNVTQLKPELIINLKTASDLGITIPDTLLAKANELITS
jgi:putative tryptophan/tyrosine transport system substrate-binding protein